MDGRKKQLHIVMLPWLAYGHIMPFLQVSKFLAEKGHHIYYVSTPNNISRLPKLPPHLCNNISFVEFELPHVDGLPPGVESTSELPIQKVPYLKKAYDQLEAPLTEFLHESSRVKWVVHDFPPHWLVPVASRLGINLVYFSIVCASTHAFCGPPSELLGGRRQRPEDFTVAGPEWMDYPNNIAYKLHEMVSHYECMDSVSDFERAATLISSCKFFALRACFEFEPDALRVLNKIYQKPIVPVGLLPPSAPPSDGDDESWEGLKKWLDAKQEKSVFYVALGSEVSLSQEFMHELAIGIEKSGLPFIWAVRTRPLVEGQLAEGIIPPGFEERVSGRGLVVRGWAPQLRILAHSSLGGFLTHCGWSSVIEALGFGLPLILFPGASSDLGLVARLMHDKKVGLEIERNDIDGSFTSDSVAESIKRVMVDPEGESVRANAKAMKEIFGSVELSHKYLDEFTRFIEEFPPSN